MEMIRFSLWNLWKKPKDAAFFAFAVVATAAVITVFFSIINDPYYGQSLQDKELITGVTEMPIIADDGSIIGVYAQQASMFDAFEKGIGSGVFTILLSLIIIGICIIVIFFANKFFLLSKSKDAGIMMVCGNTTARISKFFIVQNFAIILLFAPIGAVSGLLFTPLMNHIIYTAMNVDASIFTFTLYSAYESFITLCVVGLWLVIVDAGFVYRFYSLVDLLKADKRIKATYKNRIIILPFAYIAAYITGLCLFYTFPLDNVVFMFMFYVGFFIYFGYMNIFRFVLPAILGWLRKRLYASSSYLGIAIGNLQYSIKGASHLAMVILLSTSILLYYLGKLFENEGTRATIMIAYYASLLLICFCFLYKIMVDSVSKEAIYLNMHRIGYLKPDVRKVIRFEVFWFYLFFVILSIPQFLAIGFAYIEGGYFSLSTLIEFVSIFVIALVVTGVLSYLTYLNIILKKMKEKTLTCE